MEDHESNPRQGIKSSFRERGEVRMTRVVIGPLAEARPKILVVYLFFQYGSTLSFLANTSQLKQRWLLKLRP